MLKIFVQVKPGHTADPPEYQNILSERFEADFFFSIFRRTGEKVLFTFDVLLKFQFDVLKRHFIQQKSFERGCFVPQRFFCEGCKTFATPVFVSF